MLVALVFGKPSTEFYAMESHGSCTVVDRIQQLRLQRLAQPRVEDLLEGLVNDQLGTLLYVLGTPAVLADAPRVAAWLRSRLEELTNRQVDVLAQLLPECFGPHAYSALLASALDEVDPSNRAARCFVARLSGNDAFNRIVAAERDVPEKLEAERSIALELVRAGLHNDDTARGPWLVARARETPSILFYCWHAAFTAGDVAAAEEMLPALAQLALFPSMSESPEVWWLCRYQLSAISRFQDNLGSRATRITWFIEAVGAALARGVSWDDAARMLEWANAPAELIVQIASEVQR